MRKFNRVPLISIITVVRNDPDRLSKTIKAIAKHKGPYTEYVVIDGGSTDETKDVIVANNRIIDIWISESDEGIYDAMNKGILLASGIYLIFINAGDELLIDIEQIVQGLMDGTVVAYGKANIIGIDNSLRYVKGKRLRTIRRFLKGMPVCHQAILYKKEFMEEYDLRFRVMADRVLTYKLISKYGLGSAEYVDRVFVNYYDGGFSGQISPFRLLKEQEEFYKAISAYRYIYLKRLNYYFKVFIKTPLSALFRGY